MDRRLGLRRLPVVAGLAAAILIPAGSATPATTTKPYTANLCDLGQIVTNSLGDKVCPEGTTIPPALPGGSADVYLTLHNKANPQSLGSANIGLPTGPGPTSYASATIYWGSGNVTLPTSTLVKLRNLNLAPGRSLTVQLTLNTPACTSGTYDWGPTGIVQVKQSNDFNGPPGNDFTRDPDPTKSSLTATLSGGGCHLAIVPDNPLDLTHQPKNTIKSQPITDGFLSSGGAIQVGLYDSSHNLVVLDGTCPAGPWCVTASQPSTLGGHTSRPLQGGVAQFDDLTLATTGDYTITFTSGSLSTTSATFSIVDGGCTATDGSCSVTGVFPKTGNTPTTTADATATFAGAGGLSLRFFLQGSPPAGCENFTGTGSAGVDTSVQGSTTGFTITYGLSDKALKQVYGTNYGQPNVPICVGAQRIENGHTYTCQEDITRGKGGWTGRVLDPVTHKPNGQFDVAACGTDGLWWNVAPTFQDSPPANLPPISIVISSWGSATAADGTALRTFTITKPPPWDGKCFG